MGKLILVLLFMLNLVSNFNVQCAVSNENWMERLGSVIKERAIKDIFIPGTHDSGTGNMNESYATISADGRIPGIAKVATSKLLPWCKTQDYMIIDQLKMGVRFLDFRPSLEDNGRFYLTHGLRGEDLEKVLKDIVGFCKEHPKELIIIKIKGFRDADKYDRYNSMLIEILQKYLSSLVLHRSNLKTPLPLTKLSDILAKQKNIIIIFDTRVSKGTNRDMKRELKLNDWLFDMGVIDSYFADTYSVPELYRRLKMHNLVVSSKKLYALHYTLTANARYIVSHLNSSDGIWYFAQKLDGGKDYGKNYSLSSLMSDLKPKGCIILQDFMTPEKADFVISLNEGRTN